MWAGKRNRLLDEAVLMFVRLDLHKRYSGHAIMDVNAPH